MNGRRINLISLDNAFSPPKTVEQTRKLVEDENVFAIAGALATPTNAAVQKYLNDRKVPNLFLTSGSERFNDPMNFPWIVPLYPSYVAQGEIYGRFLRKEKPDARIGVMYENDDLGRDYLRGLKKGLGDAASRMIVAERSHEITDPMIDNLVVGIQAVGADTFIQFTNGRYAAQGIRKAASINWKPLIIIASNAASIGSTLTPAGLENSRGVISARWRKTQPIPHSTTTRAFESSRPSFRNTCPDTASAIRPGVPGYNNACAIAAVLERCGNELTPENLLKQATTLSELALPMLLADVRLSNSPTNYDAFHAMELIEFDGQKFVGRGAAVKL